MKILLCSVMHGNINKYKPLALDFCCCCCLQELCFLKKKSFLSEGKEKSSDVEEQLIIFANEVNKEDNFTESKGMSY